MEMGVDDITGRLRVKQENIKAKAPKRGRRMIKMRNKYLEEMYGGILRLIYESEEVELIR